MILLICGIYTEIPRHRQQCSGCQRDRPLGERQVKRAKYMVTEDDLTLGGRNTTQYTDHVS